MGIVVLSTVQGKEGTKKSEKAEERGVRPLKGKSTRKGRRQAGADWKWGTEGPRLFSRG